MRSPTPPSSSSTRRMSKTTPCCSKVGMKRGPWTPEEDDVLANYIRREGEGRWRTLPKRAGLLRCGKSCRLRWMNYLRPSVKRGHIAPDEEDLILRLHRLLGNRWSLIAGRIPGRTDNEIKNYWNTHLSKKLISQGIDPRTHKPLNNNSSVDNAKPSSSNAISIIPKNPNPNPNFVIAPPNISHEDNLQNFDGSGMKNGEDDQNDDIMNCCIDDVFSSFLNSLINEDVLMINAQQHQVAQCQSTNVIESETLIGSAQSNFAFGAGWDAPIMSASGTLISESIRRVIHTFYSLYFMTRLQKDDHCSPLFDTHAPGAWNHHMIELTN